MKQTVYDLWIKNKQNILLTSDGGMGKTTQLINCFRKLLSKDEYTEVPIYIDVKSIEYNEKKPIFRYLYSTYCGKIHSIENIDEKIIKSINLEKEEKLMYVFIIDGLNETTKKGNIVNDIKKLKKFKCCRFIVSSRIVEEDYVFDDFVKLKLLPLEKKNVIEYIAKKLKIKGEHQIRVLDTALLEIISNPLFLNAFCKAYGSKELLCVLKEYKKIRKADILYAYCHKMLEEVKERAVVGENNIIEFTIKFFLPRIAFVMVQENDFVATHRNIIKWLFDSDKKEAKLGEEYFRHLLCGKDFTKYMKAFLNNIDGIIEYCLYSSLIKYEENQDAYIFTHHIWRDYFASQHILNLVNSCKIDELCFLPDEVVIREFVGELIKDKGLLSECDYENKQDCNCDMSPIEYFMQSKYSILNHEPRAIGNLIEIMKTARNAHITACYDNLDLKYAKFIGCRLPNSSFRNSKIYESNFYAPGHSGYVYAATFTPDNKKIVSCGKDSTIRVWDVSTQKQIGEPLRGHENYVVSVKTIKEGQEIVSGSYDGTIRRWSIKTHKQLGVAMTGHAKRINQICVTSDEKYIISCSSDATIRIWCLHTGVQVGENLCGHKGAVNSVCVSSDGRYVISAGEDGTIRVWNFKLGKQDGNSLLGHNCSVKSICVTSNGKLIISADQKGQIRFWNMMSRMQVGDALVCDCDSIESIAVSPDNSTIFAAGYDGKIRLFDVASRTLIGQAEAHGDWINDIEISNNGKFVVSAGGDQSIKLWEATTLMPLGEPFIGTDSWINSVRITSNSRHIISAGDDAAIRIWDVIKKRMIYEPYYGHTARINEVDVSMDGTVVSASDDGTVRVWNILNKNRIPAVLCGHTAWVRTVLLSKEGNYAISGGWDNDIIVWDLVNDKIVNKFVGHQASVEALAMTKDMNLLVSGSDDNTIRFWNIKEGTECQEPIVAHDDWIRALKLLHNQKNIVTASWDNTICIWDLKTHDKIGNIKGHNNRIDALAVSNENVIISGSDDNTVRMWTEKCGIYDGKIIAEHENAVASVAVSSDSRFVVSGDGSGIIKITRIDGTESQEEIRQLGLNVFNSDLTNIDEKSMISKKFLHILFENGCII